MTVMPETRKALGISYRKIMYELRVNLCERLILAAMVVAPKGYTPSCVQAIVEAHMQYIEAGCQPQYRKRNGAVDAGG